MAAIRFEIPNDQQEGGMTERSEASQPDTGRAEDQQPEPDRRFMTGQWRGYWLQPPNRTQHHMQMALVFDNGVVNGLGVDTLGDFEIVGTYDVTDGSCDFKKRYACGRVVGRRPGAALRLLRGLVLRPVVRTVLDRARYGLSRARAAAASAHRHCRGKRQRAASPPRRRDRLQQATSRSQSRR